MSVEKLASLIGEVTMDAFPCFVVPMFRVIDKVNDAEKFALSIPVRPIFCRGRRRQFGAGVGGPLTVFWK